MTELLNLPGDQQAIRENLDEKYRDLVTRAKALLRGVADLPLTISDEPQAKHLTDAKAQLTSFAKTIEDYRRQEKQPYLDGSRAVDGWFGGAAEEVSRAVAKLRDLLGAYQRRKEEAERKRRLEDAERLRAEAEIRERAAREKEAAMRDAEGLADALAAQGHADKAKAEAAAAARAAEAPAAELARVRGDYGGVAAFRTAWSFRVVDMAALDLETLRPFLKPEHVEQAVRAFVRGGGRVLRGCEIFEERRTI